MKKYVLLLPEVTILGLSVYWFLENYWSTSHINYFALVIAMILIFQIIFKIKAIGIAIASCIAAFSLYMILAVFSEFREFETVNSEAIQLLLFGLFLCSLGIISSGLLFYKNATSQKIA